VPTIDVSLGKRSYPIIIGKGLLGDPSGWQNYIQSGKALVVTNEKVAPLYLASVQDSLADIELHSLVLEDGEQSKTIRNWSRIIDTLVGMKAGRDVCLLALGGGVIGDITGFAAASYMRGVPFVQLPTTLLAQVDASVGGKTAVNHGEGKNLIGAFHQPRAVVIDTDTLNTLPDREFRAGLAEVIKYGVIRDPEFFDWLETNSEALLQRNPSLLGSMIERSVRNKAEVVAEDELETGSRALLNFGHSFGHALETLTGYSRLLHGEAVAIGMVVATRLSEQRGLCSAGTADRVKNLLEKFALPSTLPGGITSDRILDAMKLDKKNLAGQTRLVLLEALGKARIDTESSPEEMLEALGDSR
jgi:3-dehydroquinate synthase